MMKMNSSAAAWLVALAPSRAATPSMGQAWRDGYVPPAS